MGNAINIILIILILSVGWIFLSNFRTAEGYNIITPEDARARLKEDENVILLDVRTRQEYDEKHIPGSLLIPLDSIEEEVKNQIPDNNTPIMVYCRSGNRSRNAVNLLLKEGYTNVYDLGGINNWPYEVKE